MSELLDIKRQKYLEFRDTFPNSYPKTHTCQEALSLPEGTPLSCAGRVLGIRTMGKVLFAHIFDITGKMQVFLNKNKENPEIFDSFQDQVSIGDFIGVEGELFVTKTGELTLRVHSWKLLNKALRPLPEKYHGLEDQEIRYRQRYLDIIMNEKSRQNFLTRTNVIKCLRHFLENHQFMEVDTPILQTLQSGANARPFHTHHNALDIPCVLRIAPETYHKRCIGAGFNRVYEFARSFRNEGIDQTHLQEFTILEFYAAYWNATDGINFTEKLFKSMIAELFPSAKTTIDGHEIDFSGDWPRYDYCDIVEKYSGIDIRQEKTREALINAIKSKNIHIEDLNTLEWAGIVDQLYKKVARPQLIQPCFLVKYPASTAPLARRNTESPEFVDKFQLLIAGAELLNAYAELVDPIDQRERFLEQLKAKERGDDEAMPLDEDFLLAMEHGFPPICGVGIGIDRLLQIFCGCDNIKDVVLFPIMRPLPPESY